MFDKILHVVVRIALIGVPLCACNVVGFFFLLSYFKACQSNFDSPGFDVVMSRNILLFFKIITL